MDMLDSPYAAIMGFGRERDSDGRLLLTMDYDDTKGGRPGFLHGGAIAGILETVAYATVAEALGADDTARPKPVNMTITYMRGGREQRTFARATIERLGKRLANVEAIAWQDDPSKPIAQAQINVMLARD